MLETGARSAALIVSLICLSATIPAATVDNPLSPALITVDGQFTGSINGQIQPGGEWSGVTPLAFVALPGALSKTTLGDPAANSFFYVAIAPGATSGGDELYLMYDYLARTNPFNPGDNVADISFPITIAGVVTPITVDVGANALALASGTLGVTYTFNVTRDSDKAQVGGTGIDGAVGFGPSPESASNHLLIELEIPLLITQSFSNQGNGTLPPSNGVYSPDPKFWQASATDNAGDPPISSVIFEINPNGSILASSDATLPEPSTFALGGLGLIGLAMLRRKRS